MITCGVVEDDLSDSNTDDGDGLTLAESFKECHNSIVLKKVGHID